MYDYITIYIYIILKKDSHMSKKSEKSGECQGKKYVPHLNTYLIHIHVYTVHQIYHAFSNT